MLLLLQLYRLKVHQLVSYLSQYFQFVSKPALFVLEYFLCSPMQLRLSHNFLFFTVHGNKNKNTKEKVKSEKPRKEIVLFDLKAIYFSVSYFFSRILSK